MSVFTRVTETELTVWLADYSFDGVALLVIAPVYLLLPR